MPTLAPIFVPRSTVPKDSIMPKDTAAAKKKRTRKRRQFPIRPFTHIVTPYKKSASPYDRALALYTAAFTSNSPEAGKKREYDSILRSLSCSDPACLVATRSSANPVFCDSCLSSLPDPYAHYIIPPKKNPAASTSSSTRAIPAIARFLSFSHTPPSS
jgi:hypothetical protein